MMEQNHHVHYQHPADLLQGLGVERRPAAVHLQIPPTERDQMRCLRNKMLCVSVHVQGRVRLSTCCTCSRRAAG